MIERWQALNQREQKLVVVMGAAFVIVMFYYLIWSPLNNAIAEKKSKIERYEKMAVWVTEQGQLYQSAAKGSGKNKGNLSSIINRSASQRGITITRQQVQGQNLNITIDDIEFNRLMQWLQQLADKNSVMVINSDFAKTDRPGVVRVRRLTLSQG